MITVFTGAPGAGKSAAMVDLIQRTQMDRPLYVFGLDDFKLPHIPLEDPHNWHNVVPDGAAIVIDEVQDVWRPRGPGQKVPDHIAKLETHRHRGLDFFLTTQGGKLLDGNIRDLTGRHVHIRDVGLLGRYWYEFPEFSMPVAWKTATIKKKYKLPKHVFGLYKSASIHVKPIRSFPKMLVVAVVATLLLLFMVFKVGGLIRSKVTTPAPGVMTQAPGQAGPTAAVYRPGTTPLVAARTAEDFRREAAPVVPGRAETAPMFDGLRQVVRMPRVIGGYCTPTGCRCYNQDGLDAGLDAEQCFDQVTHPRFDPYHGREVASGTPAPMPYGAAAGGPPAAPAAPASSGAT